MLLFIDTETTGLPRNFKAPPTDFDNWPRLVQVALIEYDPLGNVLNKLSKIIKPDGFSIPPEAVQIHGITTEIALSEGEALEDVLQSVFASIKDADQIIGHNISFDINILAAEFLRAGLFNILASKKTYCTMQNTTGYCKLPGKYGRYKWPTLSELHTCVFDVPFDGAHDAMADIEATAACYWELKRRNEI